jgi:hypothetical protein
MYELNHRFQNSWAIKFPCAKFVVDVDGKVTHVKCKVCNVKGRQNKFLMPKLDYLWKHVS